MEIQISHSKSKNGQDIPELSERINFNREDAQSNFQEENDEKEKIELDQ